MSARARAKGGALTRGADFVREPIDSFRLPFPVSMTTYCENEANLKPVVLTRRGRASLVTTSGRPRSEGTHCPLGGGSGPLVEHQNIKKLVLLI